MTLSEAILHEQKETNRLLRQLVSTNAEDVNAIEACRIINIKNPRALKPMRELGWFGKGGFYKRGKNYFYKKSACQAIKENLNSGTYTLSDI